MASTPKPVNGNATNGSLGKRKKHRENRGSYLSKWLDKTMHHIQEPTPSMDTYESFVNTNLNNNWQTNQTQYAPNFDPCRYNMYGCAPEPVSLPTFPTYYSPPIGLYNQDYRCVQSANKSIQVHRPRQRRQNKAVEVPGTPNGKIDTKYLLSKNFTDNQDFASLPPIVTSVGDTTSNSDMNTNEKDDGNRRYSDPCVRGLPDVAQATAERDSESDSSSDGSHVGSRLLGCLLDQISTLKTANERLNRDLMETRAELQNVRQQNAIWQKGSSTTLGSPNQSPLGNNGLLGAPYTPGILTDLVRDIRDATRVREEALFSRVRAMVLERTDTNGFSSADTKLSDRSLDDIKSAMRSAEADKRRMLDRISRLEEELRTLKLVTQSESAESVAGTDDPPEVERARLRRELADARRARHHAEDHALKLERLVTQLRSKFNGLHLASPNGPDSLPSESEHETGSGVRARRASVNSNSTTVVFGPVTDL